MVIDKIGCVPSDIPPHDEIDISYKNWRSSSSYFFNLQLFLLNSQYQKCLTKSPTTLPAHQPAAPRSSHLWKTSTALATTSPCMINTCRASLKMQRSSWAPRRPRVQAVWCYPIPALNIGDSYIAESGPDFYF